MNKEKLQIIILLIACIIGCLFADKVQALSIFSSQQIQNLDEPIIQSTEYPMYYHDQKVFIEITKERYYDCNCFVTHIILSDPQALKTCFAYDNFRLDSPMSVVAQQHNAIFMVNADYSTVDFWSNFVIRNGKIYRNANPPGALGAYFCYMIDGHLEFFDLNTTEQEALNAGVWHSFSFWGKNLFTTDGQIAVSEGGAVHPRTFMGEVPREDELLEYIIVAADGRSMESRGLTHYEEATILYEKGCTIGYNLDGGGSTEMIFDGKILNQPSAGIERNDHDFIYVEKWIEQ